MAGLDKIIDQILEEANKQADAIRNDARKQADQIVAEARNQGMALGREISEKAEIEVKNNHERTKSAMDQLKREKTLEAKQALITEVIDKAYHSVLSMSAEEYFGTLKKILEKAARPAEGTICFSQADLARMPASFKEEIRKAAEAAGGKLTISDERRNIESGFVLVYGGIEENCSFRAIFDEKHDELRDLVNRMLFL